ncbi:MAG: (2Fe-2S)-binding protein [Planctomycetes bacterium]|nr:(2Fe-2S)-binding protein [Planctomycetota bacterium]
MPSRTTESATENGDEDGPTICYCMHVREATLLRVIRAGATDLDEIAERTRAGTGCGTCRSELLELLERVAGERRSPTD